MGVTGVFRSTMWLGAVFLLGAIIFAWSQCNSQLAIIDTHGPQSYYPTEQGQIDSPGREASSLVMEKISALESVDKELAQKIAAMKTQMDKYSSGVSNSIRTADGFPPACKLSELDDLKRQLPNRQSISGKTNCPDPTWLEDETSTTDQTKYPILLSGRSWFPIENRRRPLLAIVAGCNKGMDAVNTLRMLSWNSSIDKKQWRSVISRGGVAGAACGQDDSPQYEIPTPNFQRVRAAQVHCIEAMPRTYQKLEQAIRELGWQESLKVHHYAMFETNGMAVFPNANAGTESMGIGDCLTNTPGRECVNVTQYNLDTFVKEFVDEEDSSEDTLIDFLSVDVEGYDMPVLLGASSTLRKVKYLEFEYHQAGAWKDHKLSTAILMLKKEYGFVCYWAGKDKLWRITDCWLGHYDTSKAWSNVACVSTTLAPLLLERMEDHFQRTMGEFKTQREKEVASENKIG
jgi:FkbM family methyltransferase